MLSRIEDHQILLNEVERIIKEASVFLNDAVISLSDDYNPSTNVDVEISMFLTKELTKLKDLPVLSEEAYKDFSLNTEELCWVIDPLDGTLNMLTGNSPYCISASLVDLKNATAILSCNYNPVYNELFSAIQGNGAYLNNTKIQVRNNSKQIVSYGLPYDTIENSIFHASNFQAIIKEGFVTRQSGSAIYDSILTALGKHYAFFEFGLFIWDFIGADLIARECGCKSFFRLTRENNTTNLRYDYIVVKDLEGLNKLKNILKLND